ncbi:malonate decarboxylase holo-[acyl-carrier-protein] synthase [Mycobacterium sp. E1214]|nr:malonate decarboxylase holo-[acyl-carrier-protein] synthase [Mycobacterium sp. E1214]OBH28716.1 malonate decarboxylase holo-[acyl-carrier-protein] synthase [Mycobacterium sp. E1319]
MTSARAHDLIRLEDPAAQLTGDEPPWIRAALTQTPWVVVRRAVAAPGHLAVGVRGTYRHQRHAMEVSETAVLEVLRPEDLRPSPRGSASDTAAISSLRAAMSLLDDSGYPWGPTGSAGFELATGHPTTTPSSDLDLVIRLLERPTAREIEALAAQLSALPARVDCQLDTDGGAVNLTELAGGLDRILLRTLTGARLVALEEIVTQ